MTAFFFGISISFASTGSESEMNDTYLADFLTRGFPVFFAIQCFRVFFQIYSEDSLRDNSRFHNFKYNSNVQIYLLGRGGLYDCTILENPGLRGRGSGPHRPAHHVHTNRTQRGALHHFVMCV